MSDAKATDSKADATTAGSLVEKKEEDGKKKLPQLGALEDDDEFEEFPASAEQSGNILDAMTKKDPNGPGDQLWEMNWDDDDVDDEFTKQLRTAIAERNGASDEAMKE
ncbi:DSS1/SEM1 family-domain-containing protein [Kockovaella imperatae]|uniref:26S proteasome complex subunit SEM1 n=1 Tax=Kockovaella imperatae TaxID=4999 RepID=A0A1Y1UHX7_9TREE|nr:DSS1/SEM1 family-domain-containing protein [Kockovaella imperatae]ORX37096.1 DSS1/SEM1 family-domain-containing protein [Kockovaella imperatae]